MADQTSVLIRPLLTEKTNKQTSAGKYAFQVRLDANKIQVRHAIEELFSVRVVKVNVLRVRGKSRRMGRFPPGRTPRWKKAIVTLAKGQSIPLFEGS